MICVIRNKTKSKPVGYARVATKRASKSVLLFNPVKSKMPLDLSPEKFAHSDAFSKMMDRAHAYAMRANFSYQ